MNLQKETRLDQYRQNAVDEKASSNSYKGLKIHALPGLHEYVEAAVRRLLPRGASILELAAGTGALSQRLADAGFSVMATDAVPENYRLHGSVPFHMSDLDGEFSTDFEQGFDAVVAVEIIEHLENPRNLMRQIGKLLRPGGLLFVTTPNIENPVSKAFHTRFGHHLWFSEKDRDFHGHITPLSMSQMHQCGKEAGLVPVETSTFGDPYAHVQAWWKLKLLARAISALSAAPPLVSGEILCVVFAKK